MPAAYKTNKVVRKLSFICDWRSSLHAGYSAVDLDYNIDILEQVLGIFPAFDKETIDLIFSV